MPDVRFQSFNHRIDVWLLQHAGVAAIDVENGEIWHKPSPPKRLVRINLSIRSIVYFSDFRSYQEHGPKR